MTRPNGIKYKVLAALICDDARKDTHGKDILIGVYSGDILVERFPARFSIAAWLNLEVQESGEKILEVRFVGPNGNAIFGGKIKLGVNLSGAEKSTVGLSTPTAYVTFDTPGRLAFQIRQPSGRWKNIVVKEVLEKDRP